MKNKIAKSLVALSLVASTAAVADNSNLVPTGHWLSLSYAGSYAPELLIANFTYQHAPVNSLVMGNTKGKRVTDQLGTVIRLGLGAGFDVRVGVPYVVTENKETGVKNPNGVANSSIIFGKTVLNQRAGDPVTLSFDLGAGVPTASANNAWGLKYGARISRSFAPHFVNLSFLGHEWGKSAANAAANNKPGSLYQASLTYGYAINRSFDLFSELLYDKQLGNKAENGTKGKNGSELMYLTAGVSYKNKFGTFSFGAGVPVKDKYDMNDDAKAKPKYGFKFSIPLNRPSAK